MFYGTTCLTYLSIIQNATQEHVVSFIISFSFVTYLGLFTFYSIFDHLSYRIFFLTWQKFSKMKCLLCSILNRSVCISYAFHTRIYGFAGPVNVQKNFSNGLLDLLTRFISLSLELYGRQSLHPTNARTLVALRERICTAILSTSR